MMDPVPAFELEGVTKQYTVWRRLRPVRRRGVFDVNLRVAQGQIFGLLGLNGAGKTTTMRLLVGLLRPDRGAVRVLGGGVARAETRAHIGFLPELPVLPPSFTARGLLRAYGRMGGFRGGDLERRVGSALERVRLDPRDDETLSMFSKGMRQRVAMAQVLLHDPRVVFVDEPVSGLDPEGIREMRELLLGLKASGVTVCLNSHQISEVERLCDRVGIMAAGRLVREGSVEELLASAESRRYRVSVLAPDPGGPAGGWRVHEHVADEASLAPTLTEQAERGARVLQILAERGNLEEIMLEAVRDAEHRRGTGC